MWPSPYSKVNPFPSLAKAQDGVNAGEHPCQLIHFYIVLFIEMRELQGPTNVSALVERADTRVRPYGVR